MSSGLAEDADLATPGPLADERPQLRLAEHPRQAVAAGARLLVDEHDLRPVDGGARRPEVGAVAHGPIAAERPAQGVEIVISRGWQGRSPALQWKGKRSHLQDSRRAHR